MRKKNIIQIAITTGLILMIPLIAMQISDGWNWSLSDFVFAGVLLFGTGLTYEFFASRSSNTTYRFAVGVAVFSALLLIWINAAVGIIGDDEWPNIMYFGVVIVGLIGAAIARSQPLRMSRVMFAMAITQMIVPIVALIAVPHVTTAPPGVVGVFALNAFFAALFAGSALLFRRAHEVGTI